MFGLAIVSVMCVNIFVVAVSAMASEGSEEEKSEINLTNIQKRKRKMRT